MFIKYIQEVSKIVMDLVVNHSSDEHQWFVESKKSKDNPYRDYYIWKEGKEGKEDKEYDQTTDMYYLHMFSKKQPDLNWENEKLRSEIYDMMTFWGEKGIDGFRMDVITMISKDQSYADGVVYGNSKYGDFGPYVNNGPRVHEFLKEMNQKVISKFDWMTVGEGAGACTEDALAYTGFDARELDMVFHFEHVNLGQTKYGKWSDGSFDLVELKEVFDKWETGLEGKGWNSLYWDNHDQPRAVSRFGNDSDEYREISAKMLATCLHFMKGTVYVYQGEELGMTNRKYDSFDQFKDIEIKNAYKEFVDSGILSEETMLQYVNAIGRDNARFAMHWNNSPYAGFSTVEPWIGVNENYDKINAAAQVDDTDSVFHYYKKLIKLRHEMEIMTYGVFHMIFKDHKQLFAYTRALGEEKLLVLCNFSKENVEVSLLDEQIPREFAENAKENILVTNNENIEINENIVKLEPYNAVVFH